METAADTVDPQTKRARGFKASSNSRYVFILENKTARLTLDPAGGALAAFQLHCDGKLSVNPLSWDGAVHEGRDPSDSSARMLGHFLCLDRWGPPSKSEESNGMPYHGEAAAVSWHIERKEDHPGAFMAALLPLADMQVRRDVRLVDEIKHSGDWAGVLGIVLVTESVTNINKLGRIYNMVQHPSIAAPFLNENTIVDCNGCRGLAQGAVGDIKEVSEKCVFPNATLPDGSTVSARHMTGGEDDVFSYEVSADSRFGWVCATSPEHNLLFGYIWLRTDYPWVSLWCCSRDGKPVARGLEFGTTGLHQPDPFLIQHPRIFGLPTFDHLDANESRLRKYVMFILSIPPGFRGVDRIVFEVDKYVIYEQGTSRRYCMSDDGFLS